MNTSPWVTLPWSPVFGAKCSNPTFFADAVRRLLYEPTLYFASVAQHCLQSPRARARARTFEWTRKRTRHFRVITSGKMRSILVRGNGTSLPRFAIANRMQAVMEQVFHVTCVRRLTAPPRECNRPRHDDYRLPARQRRIEPNHDLGFPLLLYTHSTGNRSNCSPGLWSDRVRARRARQNWKTQRVAASGPLVHSSKRTTRNFGR